jgi:hypothetical protein
MRIDTPGLFKSQKRAKQKANRQPGMSVKETHLPGNIGHPQEIEQSQQKTVEHSQHPGRIALSHLTMIFAQGDIPSPMQAIFNGTITNDKICLSRLRQIQRVPARPIRKAEVTDPSERNELERFPQEDTHETTDMDRSAFQYPDDRRPTSMGSGLSIPGPLEHDLPGKPMLKPQNGGAKE